VLVVASAVLCAGSRAHSADGEDLIRQGVELRRSGDDASALKLFQQAYAVGNTPKAMAQIGLAEQALGHWVAADNHLRQALQSTEDPWIHKHLGAMNQALKAVAHHVGLLEVSGSPPGAEIRVDGELVGRLPLPNPVAVTVGEVAIDVRAPGYLPITRVATTAARVLTRETFNLQLNDGGTEPPHTAVASQVSTPVVAPTLTAPRADGQPDAPSLLTVGPSSVGVAPAENAASTHRGLILGTAALSAAALGVGIVEHVSWQRKVDGFAATAGCATVLPDKGGTRCQQIYDEGRTARLVAFVGYGAAAALGATALLLYYTASSAGAVSSLPVSESPRLSCAPSIVTRGINCGGTF
jgi:hypothetical protein